MTPNYLDRQLAQYRERAAGADSATIQQLAEEIGRRADEGSCYEFMWTVNGKTECQVVEDSLDGIIQAVVDDLAHLCKPLEKSQAEAFTARLRRELSGDCTAVAATLNTFMAPMEGGPEEECSIGMEVRLLDAERLTALAAHILEGKVLARYDNPNEPKSFL